MATTNRLIAVLEAQDRASSVIRGVRGALTGLGTIAAAVGAVAIGRTLVAGMRAAVQAAAEQEVADAKVAQSIRNVGLSVDEFLPKLQAQASAFQDNVGVADELIQAGQARLLPFLKDNEELMRRATAAALDFGAVQGDTKAAFTLVAKAAAGSTAELARYGIVIDKNLEPSEKFEAVLAKLNELFGGQAAAQLNTYTGRVEELGLQFGELQEVVGGPLRDTFETVLREVITPFVRGLREGAEQSRAYPDAVSVASTALLGLADAGLAVVEAIDLVLPGQSLLTAVFVKGATAVGFWEKSLLGIAYGIANLNATLNPTAENLTALTDAALKAAGVMDTAATASDSMVGQLRANLERARQSIIDAHLGDREFLLSVGVDADAVLRLREASGSLDEFRRKLLDTVSLDPQQLDRITARFADSFGALRIEASDAADDTAEAWKKAGVETFEDWQAKAVALGQVLRETFAGAAGFDDTFIQRTLDAVKKGAEDLGTTVVDLAPELAPFLEQTTDLSEIMPQVASDTSDIPPHLRDAVAQAGQLQAAMEGVSGELSEGLLPGVVQLQDAISGFVEVGAAGMREWLDDSNVRIEALGDTINRNLRGVGVNAAVALGDAMVDAAFGAEFSWKKMFKALLADFARAIVQALVLKAIQRAFGFGGGGSVGASSLPASASPTFVPAGFQGGGAIPRLAGAVPGVSLGRDSVPALLEPGELVIPRRMAAQVVGAARSGAIPGQLGEAIASLPGVSGAAAGGPTFGEGGLAPTPRRHAGVRKGTTRARVDFGDRILSPEAVEAFTQSTSRSLTSADLSGAGPGTKLPVDALVVGPELAAELRGADRPGDRDLRKRTGTNWFQVAGQVFYVGGTLALAASSGGATLAVAGHQTLAGRKRGGLIPFAKGGLVPGASLGFAEIDAHLDPGDIVIPREPTAMLRKALTTTGNFRRGQVPVRLLAGEAVIPAGLVPMLAKAATQNPRSTTFHDGGVVPRTVPRAELGRQADRAARFSVDAALTIEIGGDLAQLVSHINARVDRGNLHLRATDLRKGSRK